MSKKGKTIEITSEMTLIQLSTIKQQLDQEIELLATSCQQLQSARNKFQESGESVDKQKNVPVQAKILVPLTGSMYVNGIVHDTNRFIVDIGTGYYVEKDLAGASDYFKRKVTFLNEQIETYMKLTQDKVNMRDAIIEALQYKQQVSMATQHLTEKAVEK